MKCNELKSVYIDRTGDWVRSENDTGKFYLKKEVDAVIADLQKTNAMLTENAVKMNRELESLKASHYAESVDAGMRERRLKRALWLARAKIAKAMKATDNLNNYLSIHKNSKWFGIYATRIDTWYYKWDDVERKCRAKAEEYK